MAAVRHEDLRDLVRLEKHLSTTDVTDANALTLFKELLKIYSRFRGKRITKELTLESGVQDYTPAIGDDDHIIGVYWNDTYPGTYSTATESETLTSEQYHNPALKAIDDLKKRREAAQTDENEQHWNEYYASDTQKIHLTEVPTTNIVIEYREKFTELTYPQGDKEILKEGLKATYLEHIYGIAELKSHGDVTYNLNGMRKAIDRHWGNFYKALQTTKAST